MSIPSEDKFINKCQEILLPDKSNIEDVLQLLRNRGYSKVESIRALERVSNIPRSEAKKIVHFSKTWNDMAKGDEDFHETLIGSIKPSKNE